MTHEQLRMQMLAGIITEGQYKAVLNENEDSGFIDFLNSNQDAIADIIGKKYSATLKEINIAKYQTNFESNNDGINTVYRLDWLDDSGIDYYASPNYWDLGVFGDLSISPTSKEFEDQIRHDFDIPEDEEIDFEDEEIPKIESMNVGGKTIFYSIVEY